MSTGKLGLMNRQGPFKIGERCEMSHFLDHHERCPHWFELNNFELKALQSGLHQIL